MNDQPDATLEQARARLGAALASIRLLRIYANGLDHGREVGASDVARRIRRILAGLDDRPLEEEPVTDTGLRRQLDAAIKALGGAEAENAELRRRISVLEQVDASNKRHVRTIIAELESADRARAEAQHDRDQHAATLARAALDEPEREEAAAEDLTGYTAPDPPIGCITATYTEPSSWLLAGTRDLDIPVMEPEPSDPTQCTGEEGFCPEHGFHRHSLKQTGEHEPDICRPVEVDGELIRVRGSGEMSDESRAARRRMINEQRAAMAKYPYEDGDVTVLGPEIFTDGTVICWKGENYVRQAEPGGVISALTGLAKHVQRAAASEQGDFALSAEPAVDRQTAVVLAALHRSAEADVTRVIDLYERWVKAGPPPIGAALSRW